MKPDKVEPGRVDPAKAAPEESEPLAEDGYPEYKPMTWDDWADEPELGRMFFAYRDEISIECDPDAASKAKSKNPEPPAQPGDPGLFGPIVHPQKNDR